MSGSVGGGSAYGVGAYGKGSYGFATRILGLAAATTGKLRPSLQVNAQLTIVGIPTVALMGWRLWTPLDIPPCQPWEAIGIGGCWSAVPNKAGSMFP